MKCVYAHFPINILIEDNNRACVRNFLGEKNNRMVKMQPGVSIRNSQVKDEFILEGISIENVSRSGKEKCQWVNLTLLCLENFLTSVIWTYYTNVNNFGIKHRMGKYSKEICWFVPYQQSSYKYFLKIAFVREISPK